MDNSQKIKNFIRTTQAMQEWHRVASAGGLISKSTADAFIGSGDFSQGIPAFWFARAVDGQMTESLYTPYKHSAWVRRAIKYVSGPISSVNLVFSKPKTDAAFRRHRGKGRRIFTSRGVVRREVDTELELPQVRQWLRQPVLGLTYEDFVEASIGWMKLDECFWLLGDETKIPFPEVSQNPYRPIIIARPDRIRPILLDGQVAVWQFQDQSGRIWKLDNEQVIRLKGWNPYDEYRGLGDYHSAHLAAESNWLGSKFKRNLTADNDTAPIISAKNGTPTDDQIQQIKMSIAERRAAKMRGTSKALFLPGEVDVHDPKILSVDAAFIAGMIEDRHEIFVAFGVPPGLADVKASYSIGQASDWFALIHNTCIPEGAKFCAALEVLIQKLTGQEVEVGLDWDEHYVMQQVRSERMKDADSLFAKAVPMSVIDEYLDLGLPDYEGKDQGFIPINLVPVSEESIESQLEVSEVTPDDFSETDPATDPATKPEDPEIKAMLEALQCRCHGAAASVPVARSAKNAQLWQRHMRLRSQSVKLIQGKCSKVLNEYRAKALRKLEHATKDKALMQRSLVDVIFDHKMFGVDLFKSLNPTIAATLQKAGDEVFDEIGQPDDPWKMAPAKVKDFISGRENLIKGVGETAFNQLKTSLVAGVDAGETTDQLADRVRNVFNNLGKFEARRIAMTETAAAYGFSRNDAMTDAGIEYKTWLTSHGGNVREAHQIAEEEYGDNPIPMDQPFVVDGESLMYPGDPAGSPGNIINCHCIQLAAQKPEE